MASGHAGSARLGLREKYRYLPLAEMRRTALNQAWLIGAMHPVTNLAGTPFAQLGDMKIVQILITIAKVSRRAGAIELESLRIVTVEAEGILLPRIGLVQTGRVIGSQERGEIRRVRRVAFPTMPPGHRFVLRPGRGNDLPDAGMAGQAQPVSGTEQQALIGTGMGIMAHRAVPRLDRPVHLFSGHDRIVTHQAQLAAGLQQQFGIGTLVGAVAAGAIIRHRRMHKRPPLDRVVMATEAKRATVGCQFHGACPRVGLVGSTVTGVAFLVGNRFVNNLGLAEECMAVGGNAIRQNTSCGQQKRARNQEENYGELSECQVKIPLNSRSHSKGK